MQRSTGRRVLAPPVGWANMLAGVCAQRDSARGRSWPRLGARTPSYDMSWPSFGTCES
jgi:hypothetical protein